MVYFLTRVLTIISLLQLHLLDHYIPPISNIVVNIEFIMQIGTTFIIFPFETEVNQSSGSTVIKEVNLILTLLGLDEAVVR